MVLGTTLRRSNRDYDCWIAIYIGVTKIDGKREVFSDLAVGYLSLTHGFLYVHYFLTQRTPVPPFMLLLDCKVTYRTELMLLPQKISKFTKSAE